MQTIYVPPNFPLNRRMRKAVRRGKLQVVREGGPVDANPNGGGGAGGSGSGIAKSHVWHPITDMPVQLSEPAKAAEEELRVLTNVWREQRSQFDPEQLGKFNRELNREWAIETGLIERAYYLERGTTRLLIERGFVEGLIPRHNGQDPAEVAAMLRDHENVIEALFDFVGGKRELSVGYIKQLHAEMLRSQETVTGIDQFGNKTRVPMNHGLFKKRPNNPFTPEGKLHEYCPWEQADSEMDRLIEMNRTHAAHPPLARAAWLHHRFVQIHPFEDGNGRIARCLATLALIRAGMFPLVVLNEERDDYLDALQAADRGDLSPLILRFAQWQKRYFVKALGIAGQVRDEFRREKIAAEWSRRDAPAESAFKEQIGSLAEFLALKGRQKQMALAEQHQAAIKTAETLHDLARGRLQQAAAQITEILGETGAAWADAAADGDERGHFYRHQIAQTAKQREYYANTEVHRAWARLVLQLADQRAMLLLSFHGIGIPYRGIIACAASFVMRRRAGGGESKWREQDPIPLGDGVFQINYREEQAQAAKRFAPWLDQVVQAALARAREEF